MNEPGLNAGWMEILYLVFFRYNMKQPEDLLRHMETYRNQTGEDIPAVSFLRSHLDGPEPDLGLLLGSMEGRSDSEIRGYFRTVLDRYDRPRTGGYP